MTGKLQISQQKWEQMRRTYLTGEFTLKELSQLYSVGYSTLRRHASANSWFVHKRSQRLLIQAETRNKLSQRLLSEAGQLQETADRCIPMSKEKHYEMLIQLLQLNQKLEFKKLEQAARQQESPQPGKVIPLRRTPRTSAASRVNISNR